MRKKQTPRPVAPPKAPEQKPVPPVVNVQVDEEKTAQAMQMFTQAHQESIASIRKLIDNLPAPPATERRPDSWSIDVVRDDEGYIESLNLQPVYNLVN
jgi:hypothetical protein